MLEVAPAPTFDKFARLNADFTAGFAAMSINGVIADCIDILEDFLFDYQIEACKKTSERLLKTKEPLLLRMATGAGKSWVLVGLSFILRRMAYQSSGKRKKFLMICPTPILAEQNHSKLIEAGFEASIYCDKLGAKDSSADIIVGTPVSLRNGLQDFSDMEFAAMALDEAQHHTKTIKDIVNFIKAKNPNMRELGLTATPHRLDSGYIYRQDTYNGYEPNDERIAKDPYYAELVFDIGPEELISRGRLVPPVFAKLDVAYEISGLKKTKTGRFTAESERNVFVNGKHQLTANIVKDIIERSEERKSVLIFAQNIEHAEMLKTYFSGDEVGVTHSKMDEDIRLDNVANFKAGKLKYLINVQSLTTGFDAPICDVVCFLRATESPALFEQMFGRGMRLSDIAGHNKTNCLILDYANNLLRHAPEGDPFHLRVSGRSELIGEMGIATIEAQCPACSHTNQFSGFTLPDKVVSSEHGYMVLEGSEEHVMSRGVDPKPLAAHNGAQCAAFKLDEDTQRNIRCSHIWSKNACSFCGQLNSPRSTYCSRCHGPLSASAESINVSQVNADDTDEDLENFNPEETVFYGERYGTVLGVKWVRSISKNGREQLIITIDVKESPYLVRKPFKGKDVRYVVVPEQDTIKLWLSPTINVPSAKQQWKLFSDFFFGHEQNINSIDLALSAPVIRQLAHVVYRVTEPTKGAPSSLRFFELQQYFGSLKHN